MNEKSYINMANNLNNYLQEYCGVSLQNDPAIDSVEDVLTQLIHMNNENTNQEGGIMMEELIQNMTGGDAKTKVSTDAKPEVINEIIEVSQKSLDTNLMEGGSKDTPEENNNQDDKNEESSGNDNQVGGHEEEGSETDNEEYSESGSDSESDTYSESGTSDDEDENMIGGDDTVNEHDTYSQFLSHYRDRELKITMTGGNTKDRTKIQIIPMFPYLLRY